MSAAAGAARSRLPGLIYVSQSLEPANVASMPALPTVPNVLRYDTVFAVGSDTTATVGMYFTYGGTPPSAANCGALAATAATFGAAQFPQLMHPDNAFERVEVVDLSSTSGGAGQSANRAAGNRTGPTLAASACLLVNYVINRRYRGGKPRSYFPFGVATDLVTPQTWSSTFLTTAQTVLFNYINAIVTSSQGGTALSAHCSVSFYQGFTAVNNPVTGRTKDVPKVRTPPIPVDIVTGTLLNPNVGTQRRRISA